jgi:hypothetical protein
MDKNLTSAEELKTIRKIMEESSRFLSLSGLSGIFAGTFAIAGALIAYFLILDNGNIQYNEYLKDLSGKEILIFRWHLITDALSVLVFSLLFSFYFSIRKAKRTGRRVWTPVSKRLLINLFIPLVTGGLFVIVFLIQNHDLLVIPCLLLFYGLSLVNAGKFTYGEVFYLGILEIMAGLISAIFPGQAIFFWIFGFGILHIVYGLFMYRKYEA